MNPQYLGDGVYASYDGYHVVLTTGSHERSEASNVICLEPEVIESLEGYVKRLRETLHHNGIDKPLTTE